MKQQDKFNVKLKNRFATFSTFLSYTFYHTVNILLPKLKELRINLPDKNKLFTLVHP